MPKSLAQYLEMLKHNYPDELNVVSREIRPAEFEVTALLENLTSEERYPAVLFNNPQNVNGQASDIKLVSSLFARRERCALALDMNPRDSKMPLSLEYARREKLSIPPEVVNGPVPVQEIVFTGEQIDVGQLPIVKHYEMDMGPVMTMLCCMRDPDTGVYDISFIKNFYKGKRDYLGLSIHSAHLERILQRYAEMNKPAPVITILGHHPAFFLGSLALTRFDSDDYETIGGYLGEPLRLAPSITWGNDFLVPADAEIIIEGEILPGVKELVDPFGEITGFYQPQCLRQAMQVTAITRRREAIMEDIFSGHQEHWVIGGLPKEGSVYNTLQSKVGNIVAVHRPFSGASTSCYISIKKLSEGQGKITGLIALNETWTFQVVIVVDEDIDVFNEREVIWAALTMTDPQRDVEFIKNVGNTVYMTELINNKVVIDATRPLDKPFPARFKIPPKALKAMRPEEWID